LANLLQFYYTFSQNLVIKNPKPKPFFWEIYILKKLPHPKIIIIIILLLLFLFLKLKKKKHPGTIQGNYLSIPVLCTCLEQNHYICNHETPIESTMGVLGMHLMLILKVPKGLLKFYFLPRDAILNVMCVHTCKCQQHAQLIVSIFSYQMCHACKTYYYNIF